MGNVCNSCCPRDQPNTTNPPYESFDRLYNNGNYNHSNKKSRLQGLPITGINQSVSGNSGSTGNMQTSASTGNKQTAHMANNSKINTNKSFWSSTVQASQQPRAGKLGEPMR